MHTYLDRSPAFLTSDDIIRSNEIIRTKWLIYVVIQRKYHQNVRKAGDQPNFLLVLFSHN